MQRPFKTFNYIIACTEFAAFYIDRVHPAVTIRQEINEISIHSSICKRTFIKKKVEIHHTEIKRNPVVFAFYRQYEQIKQRYLY